MRPVKTQPRFRCDFCRKTGVKRSIEAHEPICWNNPDRFCGLCENRGFQVIVYQEADFGENTLSPELSETVPCYYCSQFDPQVAARVAS